jgi:hypothetical protein
MMFLGYKNNYCKPAVLLLITLSTGVMAQKADSSQVTCYKSQIKNPYSFLGMSGDRFELSDGSSWRVSGNTYTYTSNSSGNILICPELGKMFILNMAITVEKSTQKAW